MNSSFRALLAASFFIAFVTLATAPARADILLQNCGFTIPCPTNTPGSGGGSGGSGGSGGNPTTTPAATQATPTPAGPTSTPFPTPLGGYLPTAEPCSLEPTATSFASNLNVRLGPGTDYPVATQMVYFESRPIIGRYAYGDWWQIRLGDGRAGWVKDSVVLVNGNTGAIPLVEAPPLAGSMPTPGAEWQPTPQPECPLVVLPTATTTAEATVAPPAATMTLSATASATAEPALAEAGNTEPTATMTAQPAATAAQTDTPAPTAVPSPTMAPLPDEGNGGSSGSNGLFVGGVILVMLGVAGFFVLGRRRSGPPAD